MFPRLLCGLAMMLVYSGAWSAALQDNGDGTVRDLTTGSVWQQVDDDTKRNWKDAHAYCDDLSLGGETDWRLPDPTELTSIVVYQTGNPSIDNALFPSTRSLGYWSASSMAGDSSKAWYVDFYYGPVDFNPKWKSHYARCIR